MPPARQSDRLRSGTLSAPILGWDDEVSALRGVGPATRERMARLGVHTIGDLLMHLPRGYQDRRRLLPLAQVAAGSDACVSATVMRTGSFLHRGRRMPTITIADDVGDMATLYAFGRPQLGRTLTTGQPVLVYGRFERRNGRVQAGSFELMSPEEMAAGTLIPVYPATAGLAQRLLRRLIDDALAAAAPSARYLLPREVAAARRLPDKGEALRCLHGPPDPEEAERARRALAYEELFLLQLELARRSPAGRPRPAPRRRAGRAAGGGAGAAAVHADRRAARRPRRDRRRSPWASYLCPAAAGRRGLRQDSGGAVGGRRRDRRRSTGGGRGPVGSALLPACGDRVEAAGAAGRAAGVAVRKHRPGCPHPPAPGPGRRRHRRAAEHPRRALRAGPIRRPGAGGHRRATQVRGRPAGRRRRQGARRRPDPDDRHADPADAGAHVLRRPDAELDRPPAAGTPAAAYPPGARGAPGAGVRACRIRAGRRPPGVLRLSVDRRRRHGVGRHGGGRQRRPVRRGRGSGPGSRVCG